MENVIDNITNYLEQAKEQADKLHEQLKEKEELLEKANAKIAMLENRNKQAVKEARHLLEEFNEIVRRFEDFARERGELYPDLEISNEQSSYREELKEEIKKELQKELDMGKNEENKIVEFNEVRAAK